MTLNKTPAHARPWTELRAQSAEEFRAVLLAELDRQIGVVAQAAAHAPVQRDAARIAGELATLNALRSIVQGADLEPAAEGRAATTKPGGPHA